MEVIAKRFDFSLSDPINKIPRKAIEVIMRGGKERFSLPSKTLGITRDYKIEYEGIENFIIHQFENTDSAGIKRWASNFMDEKECSSCNGMRLNKESLNFKIDNLNIGEVSEFDLDDLFNWISQLKNKLSDSDKIIAEEIIKEIQNRLNSS